MSTTHLEALDGGVGAIKNALHHSRTVGEVFAGARRQYLRGCSRVNHYCVEEVGAVYRHRDVLHEGGVEGNFKVLLRVLLHLLSHDAERGIGLEFERKRGRGRKLKSEADFFNLLHSLTCNSN